MVDTSAARTLTASTGRTPASRTSKISALLLAAALACLGIGVSVLGATDLRVVVPVVVVWLALAVVKVGSQRLPTALMMAAAFAAPMNGVRPLPALALIDVFLLASALPLLAHALRSRDRTPVSGMAPFLFGSLLILIGGSLGTFFAPSPLASMANLFRFTIAVVGPLVLLWAWRPDPGQVRKLAWLWTTGSVLSALVSVISAQWSGGRAAGLTTHPNQLALISAFGAGLALALASSSHGWRRWYAGAAFAVLSLAIVQSGSRAGLLAWAVTNVIFIARDRPLRESLQRKSAYVPVVGGVALSIVLLVTTGTIELGRHNAISRTLGDVTSETSDRQRLDFLERGVDTVSSHPLTGNGFGIARQAHNVYLQVTAAGGVLSLIGFLLLAVTTLRNGFRWPGSTPNGLLAAAFVAGYLGYLAAGLFQNLLWDRYVWFHAAVIVWLGCAPQEAVPAERCA